jgi:hypothetical protein
MTLKNCIDTAVAGGEMDPGKAARAKALFDEIEATYRGRMNHGEAARQAGEATVAAVKREAAEAKRVKLLQIRALAEAEFNLRGYRNSKGESDLGAALQALFDRDEYARYANVEARRKAVRGRLHARMDEVLHRHKRDLLGRTGNRAGLDNMVRAAFGDVVNDPAARELADAWNAAAEFARLRFNAAGGAIPKRADWGLPQTHDSLAVRKAGYQEWRDFIAPKLAPERMADELTGLAHTPQSLELALRAVFETIATDGWSKLRPGQQGARRLASRRADHRFLAFRGADDWLAYNARFGAGDPFSTMMAHLDGMARDIARLEILGPNDHLTVAALKDTVMRAAAFADARAGTNVATESASRALDTADKLYAHITGAANVPIGGAIPRGFAALRSLLSSAYLGSAAISSLTDLNTMRIAAQMNGLPQARTIARHLKLLNPAAVEDRKLAVRLGLIAEHWSGIALGQARYVDEFNAPAWAARISDAVLRVSGLSPWTQAGRWAFGMEFMGTLADNAGRDFAALDPVLRKALGRYGIGAGDWDLIRKSPLHEHGGAAFLRPDDVAARTDLPSGLADRLGTRLLEMIQSETEFAVPSASLRARVALVSDVQPGTLVGELLRSTAMFKNFAVTMVYTHVMRAAAERDWSRTGAHLVGLAISATLFGALALQLKDIAKGRDPRPMGDPAFWGAALMQGGGMGILGDFLYGGLSRAGGGLAETIAGPVVGFLNEARNLTVGNLAAVAAGKDANFGYDLTQFLRHNTPGSSIWYARLAFERLVIDQLQLMIDPDAHERMRAIERRARREMGQGYWWRPGEAAPARAPQLNTAWGGR